MLTISTILKQSPVCRGNPGNYPAGQGFKFEIHPIEDPPCMWLVWRQFAREATQSNCGINLRSPAAIGNKATSKYGNVRASIKDKGNSLSLKTTMTDGIVRIVRKPPPFPKYLSEPPNEESLRDRRGVN
ncbi:hypothetical protein AVEN_132298-1 [Araneus ventricosus]|uniref:Uncharacterized protein n=1 Tax=Araneus ventricosus TaxID=182803 RepID=A0A4Y2T951_ARAVE|nr:hypothetical protein AVEN_132298-1 [Araneus ventricosus]